MRTAIDTLLIIEKIYITKCRSCPQLLLKPVDNFQLKYFLDKNDSFFICACRLDSAGFFVSVVNNLPSKFLKIDFKAVFLPVERFYAFFALDKSHKILLTLFVFC